MLILRAAQRTLPARPQANRTGDWTDCEIWFRHDRPAPMYKLGKFFYVPGRLNKVKRKNLSITLGLLAGVIDSIG